MRAVVCENYGTPDVLRISDVPPPVPAAGQIRITMHAASVNYPDGLMVANKYQMVASLPFTPGQEGAGVIDALGEDVTGLSVGDRVMACVSHGAFAGQMLADASRAVPIGDNVPFAEAAAFMAGHGTSLHALRTRGELQPGETLLVLGAGGGVGSAAVELGKLMGATVIAAASSDEKLAVAAALGADHLVNYGTADLREQLRKLPVKAIDVIYDPVGGKLAEPAFRSIGWRGRYLVIGFAGGPIASLPLNLPLLKGASVIGVFWGAAIEREPEQFRADSADLVRWLAEGKLKPHIGKRYPLERSGEALADLMEGRALGKLVIEIR